MTLARESGVPSGKPELQNAISSPALTLHSEMSMPFSPTNTTPSFGILVSSAWAPATVKRRIKMSDKEILYKSIIEYYFRFFRCLRGGDHF
ncbi:MAG: hypothetical protein BWY05_01312 [Euryarchaeota archaeon ADurb.Bin165]|nr:MAG: hypothetical protein BWY05_01312 [Euryarchaeota archaeon ADurb.Bin165]